MVTIIKKEAGQIMDDSMQGSCPTSPDISKVVREIDGLFPHAQIYLFNHKLDRNHEISSFKLCVIYDFADKGEAERTIYLDIDCDVPFDVVLYNQTEWDRMRAQPDSFACRVCQMGYVVHD
jgi:hypothetical protein